MFQNGYHIYVLSFGDISDSLIHSNRLYFAKIEDMHVQTRLESLRDILIVEFCLYYETLSENILSAFLFGSVRIVKIEGLLTKVNGDFVNKFRQLNTLKLKLSNMREFFHTDTKWMNSFNYDIIESIQNGDDIEVSRLKIIHFVYPKEKAAFDRIYTYPNEDICLFINFPHMQFVVPIIMPGVRLECTCTLKYLQMYVKDYYARNGFVNLTSEYVDFEEDLIPVTFLFCDDEKTECDFDKMNETCFLAQSKSSKGSNNFNGLYLFFLLINMLVNRSILHLKTKDYFKEISKVKVDLLSEKSIKK
jgi:hypothetical protein